MRGQGGAWSLVCGLWAPGDPQFQSSLPVACGALPRATDELPSCSWERNMKRQSKTECKEGQEKPKVDRDSKTNKTSESAIRTDSKLSTGTRFKEDIFDDARSSPISGKRENGRSEAKQTDTGVTTQLLSFMGWHFLSVTKTERPRNAVPMIRNSKFMPRVLQIRNKNSTDAKLDKLPKPREDSSQAIADPQDIKENSATHSSKSPDSTVTRNMPDVKDTNRIAVMDPVKSDVEVQVDEDPKPATPPSYDKNESKVSPEKPASAEPSATGQKENEDPASDPYEEFDNCRRHPDCKFTLEEVKGMADKLPACMGIRVRVNYIRQIYKHGMDPDTWNWKQYEGIVPDYTFLLSQPIQVTKDVPHPNCKVTKTWLHKLSQSLPFAKSRKCFVFLCFYHGLDPEETLRRISDNPLGPWVACPEPWMTLESAPKPPEYPRVKEGCYTVKSASCSRDQVTPPKRDEDSRPGAKEAAVGQPKTEEDSAVSPSSHSQSSADSASAIEKTTIKQPENADDSAGVSSRSQCDPSSAPKTNKDTIDNRPEPEVESAASTASQTQSGSETSKEPPILKTRYKIINSGKNVATNRSSPSTSCSVGAIKTPANPSSHAKSESPTESKTRKASQCQDSKPSPQNLKRPRPLMELDTMDSQARDPRCRQVDGLYSQQQMGNVRQTQFQSSQYPMAGNNFYLSWNYNSQCWNYGAPWNSSGSFDGRMYNIQSNSYQTPDPSMYGWQSGSYPAPNGHAWNSSAYSKEFVGSPSAVDDVRWNPSSDAAMDHENLPAGTECSSSVNSGSASQDSSAVPPKAAEAKAVSNKGGRPLESQTDLPLDPKGVCKDTPRRAPLPAGGSCQEFSPDSSRGVIAPSNLSQSDSQPPTCSSSVTGDQPPLPPGSPPPLPPDPPPPLPPPPPPLSLPPLLLSVIPPPPPSYPPPPTPPPSAESEEMDWMELEPTELEHQQGSETVNPCSTDLETVPSEPQKPAVSIPKFTIPKFTIQKLKPPEQNSKPPIESDMANKDPASLNRSSTMEESSETSQIDTERRHIPVFIEPADYPYSRLSDEQMTVIENNILDAILEIDKTGAKPVFKESFRRNGRYGVICSDDFSRKWLYAYLGTHKPWPNSNLRIVSKNFTEVRANAILPVCLDDSNAKILKFIDRQNEGLDVSKWEVVRRWESGDLKTCMDLVIDEKSAKVLEKNSSIIFKMGAGKIITVRKKMFDSELSGELKKSAEFDALEDDIYADFCDEKSPVELEKFTEFDSLEHDIYADFYGEKTSLGSSKKAKSAESNKHLSSDRNTLDCLRNEGDRSRLVRWNSPSRSSSRLAQSPESYQHDWSPSRDVISKIPKDKKRWSPKPGGGLCPRQDPYSRREGILEDWYSQKLRSRWGSRSPSNSGRSVRDSGGHSSLPQTDGMERNSDKSLLSGRSSSRDSFLKHGDRPRGNPSPCRCRDGGRSVEVSAQLRRPERSASRSPSPRSPSQSQASPDRHRSTSISTFPRMLSFQTQGLTDKMLSVCPSPPKIHSSIFASPVLDNVKVEGSDLLGSDLRDTVQQSINLPVGSQSPPGQRVQDVLADDRRDQDSKATRGVCGPDQESVTASISRLLHPGQLVQQAAGGSLEDEGSNAIESHSPVSNQESSKLPISVQHHPAIIQLMQRLANNDLEVEDSHPLESDLQDDDQDSSVLTTSIQHRPGQLSRDAAKDDYSADDSISSESGSQDSDQDCSDLPIPFEYRPGQSLQDVSTDLFRKLIAAGYSCEKALQITQAFVSKQLNASLEAEPEPPKPPSPQPPQEPTLQEVISDKFSKLVAAGISPVNALLFTQALIHGQVGLPQPPTVLTPQSYLRDTDMRVGINALFSLRGKAESGANFPAVGHGGRSDHTGET